MRGINKHTAWIKHELMKEQMGQEWSQQWREKYKLWDAEPQPRLERHRHDIYFRGRKFYYIWRMSAPRIRFYWPLRWPVKLYWHIEKTKRSR